MRDPFTGVATERSGADWTCPSRTAALDAVGTTDPATRSVTMASSPSPRARRRAARCRPRTRKATTMIRAKMVCSAITKDASGNESVTLYPVTSGSDENKQWSKWTPGGQLQLSISNPDAQGKFTPAKEYFVDVSEVPAAVESKPAA